MREANVKSRHRFVKVIVLVAIALAALVTGALYLDWSAARKAQKFCDAIEIGSDIALTVAKAKDMKVFYGTARWYTFYFPGFVFNKAVCEVSVTMDGKVAQKGSSMEYD